MLRALTGLATRGTTRQRGKSSRDSDSCPEVVQDSRSPGGISRNNEKAHYCRERRSRGGRGCDERTPGAPPSVTRMLFEIRVTGEAWSLDAFATGPGYKQTLLFQDKLFPVG